MSEQINHVIHLINILGKYVAKNKHYYLWILLLTTIMKKNQVDGPFRFPLERMKKGARDIVMRKKHSYRWLETTYYVSLPEMGDLWSTR